ncbi:hypothetical protein EDD11_006503 [Mortierella claussenii]|nr:hypothetical protein EDD11_006503 [Mortierella claussenii]
MVWSSAQPHSVDAMLKFGFGNRISKLDRVWTRQHFRLPEVDYARKVLTIKDLEYVWEGIAEEKKQHLATSEPNQGADKFQVEYDQTNTVLIDDSTAKIQLQPYNGLTLRDFDAELAKAGTDRELLKVMKYLEKLVYQQNVSAYMRLHPFDTNAPIDVVKQAKLAPEPSSDMDTLINRLQETSLTEQ